jgi:hypothetical protein
VVEVTHLKIILGLVVWWFGGLVVCEAGAARVGRLEQGVIGWKAVGILVPALVADLNIDAVGE